MTLSIAIVGRPNVGKSTLFNRLVGKKVALTHDLPGLTRDWREAEANLMGYEFMLRDTAGIEDGRDGLDANIRAHTINAAKSADVLLFVFDAREGIAAADKMLARELRKLGKPIYLLANKCEGNIVKAQLAEAYTLGLGQPVPISAEHGEGIAHIFEILEPHFKEDAGETGEDADEDESEEAAAQKPMRLVIMGKPNAGKSTLVNALLGEQRMITGPEAGITRDAIDIDWEWRGRPIKLYDTAGVRRKSRIGEKLEELAVGDTIKCLRYADLIVLMVDAQEGITQQDLTLADLIEREGRAIVIAVNKWDAIKDKSAKRKEIEEQIEESLPQLRGVPVAYISAANAQHLDQLMKAVAAQYDIWNKRIGTGALNAWLEKTVEAYPPPMVKGRRIKIRYGTQIKTRPPAFAFFANQDLPTTYERYLLNQLREYFDMPGVPVRFNWRKGGNPYDKKKKKA